MDLKKLIKEALDNRNCCQATKPKKSFILNESVAPREILSEGLKYHIDNNKPLTEHLYRAGSDKYFHLWAEARSFYSRNIIEVTNADDLAILTETNLGEFGTLEDGTRVPLDFIMEDVYLDLNEMALDSPNVEKTLEKLEKHWEELGFGSYEIAKQYIKDHGVEEFERIKDELNALTEAKTGKKKDPPVGKPMRDSSGGKAYKVYVRDPKTKKIKTVRFGSGGLKAKINNPKARQAFAKRHKCSTRNDKTKASYWSCRLPRYAKLLGLKSSFSGFW